MQMAWDESRMTFCYCFCFCPTVCISVGVRSEKKNVYDRISRVVFANVQHGERCRSCQDSPMLIVCQRAVA
jgi:hypothetical protein